MDISNKVMVNDIDVQGDMVYPRVYLSKLKNTFQFSGISIPEDADQFYSPLLNWLNEYSKVPNPSSEFVFKMEYMNRESAEMIQKIIHKLQEIYDKGNKILIKWYYHYDDEDMLDEGREFAQNFAIPFELINYKN
jgi:hypothetical protein